MASLAVLNLSLDNSDVSEKAKETTSLFAKMGEALKGAFAARVGIGDANAALADMQSSLLAANGASSPLAATMGRLEGALHGAAAAARVGTTAIALLPKVFSGLPPAITRTLNSVSLASRAVNVLRGELSPLGAALGYVELRNLGVRKSYAALAATMGMATSSVVKAGRSITGSLGAVASGGNRAFRGVTSIVGALAIGSMGLAGPLIGAAGAAGVAAVGFAGLKKAFDLGGELTDLTARTGIAVRDLVVMRQAFSNAGKGADDVGPAVNRLQKALAGVNEDGEPTNATFEQLGLNMERLRNLSPATQFAAVSRAIAKIPNEAQRAAMAINIFGKSGAELLAIFADSNAFGDAAKQVGVQAEILDRNAGLFDKISDTLGTVGTKIQGFFVGAADKLAPILEPIMDWFAGVDVAAIGQRAGAAIAGIVGILTNGSAWDAFGAGLVATFQHSINSGWALLRGVISAAGAYGGEVIKNALTLFSIVTRPAFWSGVGHALMAMAASFNAMLLDGVGKVLDQLRSVPWAGAAVGKAADYAHSQAEAQRRFAASDSGASADLLGPAFDEFVQRLNDAGRNVANAFAKGRDEAGNLIDSSGNDVALATAVEKMTATFKDAAAVKNSSAGKKQTPFDLDLAKKESGKEGPRAERLFSNGFGLFVRDPLAQVARDQVSEQRRTNGLLQQVIKNTAPRPAATLPNMTLRFI